MPCVGVSDLLGSSGGVATHDHVCCAFDERDDYRSQAVAFLSEGIELGLQVAYVGTGTVGALTEELTEIDGLDELIATDALRVMLLDDAYGVEPKRPVEQVADYADATAKALRAGFGGLRVAADATSLVRSSEHLDAFARYEHLIDRYMASAPFSAMCGYDRRAIDRDALEDIACMHPLGSEGTSAFCLFAVDDHTLALRGEIDIASQPAFERALARVDPPGRRNLVLEISGLEFVDHRGLLALSRYASAHEIMIVLQSESAIVRRLIEVLGIPHITTAGGSS